MAVAIKAKEYLDRAAAGEQLTAEERRHAVLYVMGQNSAVTQEQLANMFAVSTSQIRLDIKKNKANLTDEAKATYLDTAVQDLIHEQHVRYEGIKKSLEKADLGTRVRLDHEMALMKIRHDTIRILQEIGALPKSLSEVSAKKEVFKAEVQPNTNQVVVRPVDMFDGFEDGEGLEEKLRRENRLELLGGEYLETPEDMNGQNSNEEKPVTGSVGSEQ